MFLRGAAAAAMTRGAMFGRVTEEILTWLKQQDMAITGVIAGQPSVDTGTATSQADNVCLLCRSRLLCRSVPCGALVVVPPRRSFAIRSTSADCKFLKRSLSARSNLSDGAFETRTNLLSDRPNGLVARKA
jgi:hypothetical protein